MIKRSDFLLAIAMSSALHATGAAAQASDPAGDAASSTSPSYHGLEQVVVTARKREESFLDVPVVSTVLSQSALEATKIDSAYALTTRVPSLLLGDSVNSTGTQLSLRGVGTMALNATMDQSVSLDVDGVPMTQALAYAVAIFDVGRVEVFKGPQSLFFGKNSTAGVISLRSADPTSEREIITRAGYEFEANEQQYDVILSGPVTDSLKLRLAGRYSDQDGFFTNAAVATPGLGGITPTYSDFAPTENTILRGTALYEPNPAFTARLKLNYNHYNSASGSPLQIGYCPEGTGGVPPLNVSFMAGDACKLDREFRVPWFDPAAFAGVPNGGRQFTKRDQAFGSLDLSYEFSKELSVSSVTGYYSTDFDTLQPGNTTGTTQTLAAPIKFENRQFTQEVRLASAYESPVNFMVGAFYQDGRMRNDVLVIGNSVFNLPAVVQHPIFDVDNTSFSLFAQMTWDITQKLELAAGARWTEEERSMTETNLGPAQGPIGPVARPDPEISSSNVSPEVTLTFKATDTLTAYAAYKTGFKSGSFNTISFVPSNRRASFDDEEVNGGEIGLKMRTEGGQVTAEIAAYYFQYDDLQVGALELAESQGGVPAPFLRTLNAASAIVKGIDADITYSPDAVDGLTVTAALNYNRARYDSFPNAPCGNGQTIGEGCDQLLNPLTGRYTAQDLSGQPLVRAPDLSANLGFSQRISLRNGMSLNFGAGVSYSDMYQTVLPDLPGFEQDDFVKADANIALSGVDDAWEFALIGRNLGNEMTTGWCANANVQNSVFGGQIAGAATGGPAGHDESTCYVERGREVWARATIKF